MATARKTTSTTFVLGAVGGVPVALHKVTTDGGKEAKWETRLVDAKGKPIEPEAPSSSLSLSGVHEQGDPLGVTEDYNERASEALEEAEDAARAWNLDAASTAITAGAQAGAQARPHPGYVEGPDGPALAEPVRQRGFKTVRRFVPAEKELDAIAAYTQLDRMEVVGFVRAEQVARSRTIGSYYLVPEKDTSGAAARHVLEVLKGGLQRASRMAVVKWTKGGRSSSQSLGVITPDRGGGLVLLELAWGENVRTIPKTGVLNMDLATTQEVDACVGLIDAMSEPRATLDEMRDDARVLREQARELAEQGRLDEFTVPEEVVVELPSTGLEDALDASAKVGGEFVAQR